MAQAFGKYEFVKKLATGGMAEVWYARQRGIEGFQKEVVCKRILPHLAEDAEFVQMFKHEALVAARFNHPNIAQVYEFGEINGSHFIAMEYIHGEDLGRVMRKAWSSGQWIARPLALRIVAACCEGLYYAHTKADEAGRPLRVVHRDISPQNILISFDGSVKLVDFGIAKAADQANLTKSGAIKGKFAYMAPEQAAGKPLDHRVDVFAMGLVLYELLTGVRPLKRDTELGTLQAALECAIEPPSAVADVPAELDPVVMRALAKTADDRYRDARQFQMALEEFLVTQRWVASSVQISELMATLFADRLQQEAQAGQHMPHGLESQLSGMPSLPGPQEPSTDPHHAPASPGSDMSWEAPPGPLPGAREPVREGTQRATPRSISRTGVPQATGSHGRLDSAAAGPPTGEVPDWEAPPAADVPRRRTGETRAAELSRRVNVSRVVREPTRTRLAEAPQRRPREEEEDEAYLAEENDAEATRMEAAPRARSRSLPAMPRASADATRMEPAPVRAEPETAAVEAPQEPPRRRASVVALPAAEPRRRTVSRVARVQAYAEPEPEEAPAPEVPAGPDPAELAFVAELRRRQLQRYATVAAVVVLAGLAFLFRRTLVDVLGRSGVDRTSVAIQVESNLSVDVWVLHHADEGKRDPTHLGEGKALGPVYGAHLKDTVVLENRQVGARWEKPLEFGTPGETVPIHHEFVIGKVRLDVKPRPSAPVEVWLEGQLRGRTTTPIELYEGPKTLELRSKAFIQPRLVELTVRPGQTDEVVVDVRDVLAQ